MSFLLKAKAHLSGVAWAANRFARQPRDILFPDIRVRYLLINCNTKILYYTTQATLETKRLANTVFGSIEKRKLHNFDKVFLSRFVICFGKPVPNLNLVIHVVFSFLHLKDAIFCSNPKISNWCHRFTSKKLASLLY